MNLSDPIVRLIRTWVPIGLGWLIAWLFGLAPWLEDVLSINIETATALTVAAYYALAAWLENFNPFFGWLLGIPKARAQAPTNRTL